MAYRQKQRLVIQKKKQLPSNTNNKDNKPGDENPYSSYARYWGLAVQMILIITAGSFGGYKIDDWLNLSVPVFTLILSLSSVTLAIWLFIKETNVNNKKK